jgi:predicted  nucleic acid-binding Zn-ribbon protein
MTKKEYDLQREIRNLKMRNKSLRTAIYAVKGQLKHLQKNVNANIPSGMEHSNIIEEYYEAL